MFLVTTANQLGTPSKLYAYEEYDLYPEGAVTVKDTVSLGFKSTLAFGTNTVPEAETFNVPVQE